MFKRRKDDLRTELDAAWEDDNPTSNNQVAEDAENLDTTFPEPHEFNLTSDTVPTDSDARNAAGDVPFDEEDSFAYDADSDEFTSGDAKGFLDDSHTDYYRYGEHMHGVHDTPEKPEDVGAEQSVAVVGTKHGRHGSGMTSKQVALENMSENQRHSRSVRRTLTVVIILLLALMAALGYFGWRLFQESRSVAEQQGNEVVTEVEEAAVTEEVSQDAATANVKKTEVPSLLGLLGLTSDEAVKQLGHGATVTLDSQVADEASPMSNRLTVVLTDEPADAKSGAPTAYLGMDAEGKVVTAGYSAATASLGYGTLSFADAVSNEHVVEKTLGDAGLTLQEGQVELPDAASYSTYADDGTTLIKEQCAFDGQASQNGTEYLWTSVLVYNYTAANATGNLADTVRQIYIYVSEKDASDAAVAAKAAAKKDAEKKEAESSKKDEQAASSAPEAKESSAEESSAAPEAQSSAAA